MQKRKISIPMPVSIRQPATETLLPPYLYATDSTNTSNNNCNDNYDNDNKINVQANKKVFDIANIDTSAMEPIGVSKKPRIHNGYLSSDSQQLSLPARLPTPSSFATGCCGIVYSQTGFDILGLLVRVYSRPNPQIDLGPVDFNTSIVLVDALKPDSPVVYVNDQFEILTGYKCSEVLGRNCRFLQAPGGHVTPGSIRTYTDSATVYHMRNKINAGQECQASIVNYRKNGEPFINNITAIPITFNNNSIAYYVGFIRGSDNMIKQAM
ncbi:2654_t:CDS:2 [Ambispora gerdemannii]|uniref:2654_t:CDS:1 n=1 Tax=Ambispora gerdemannii TaxID=144530 RepID=A0A9N9AXB5_9GLOM|nr:2654_t:CDS:2 [Ambispora gerdemannii]